MNNSSIYRSYLFEIKLPEPIVVPAGILTVGYAIVLAFDFLLVRNEKKLSKFISPLQLYTLIGLYHFILPILFESKYNFGNISFMLHPWSVAGQIIFLANSNMTAKQWVWNCVKIASCQDESPTTDTNREIRIKGLKKVARGCAKIAFMKIVLDRLLPDDLSILLSYPVFSLDSLYLTYILAFRIYCMVSVSDVITGLVQALFSIRFLDTFDNPFMAYSPLDFWNRRWNRTVSRLFHQLLFVRATKQHKKEDNEERTKSWIDFIYTPTGCGLLIFIISGLSHDFMIAAVAREITFELTAFFLIHGVAVGIEANLCKGKYKKAPTGLNYLICNVITVVFFLTTGRIFLNPVLRHDEFLKVAQQF